MASDDFEIGLLETLREQGRAIVGALGYCWTDGCAVLVCATCGAGVARLQLAFEVPS